MWEHTYILDKDTFNILQIFTILNCAAGNRLTLHVVSAINAQVMVWNSQKDVERYQQSYTVTCVSHQYQEWDEELYLEHYPSYKVAKNNATHYSLIRMWKHKNTKFIF